MTVKTVRQQRDADDARERRELGFMFGTLRRLYGVRQAKVAECAGISQNTVTKFERGFFPSDELTLSIVHALPKLCAGRKPLVAEEPTPADLEAQRAFAAKPHRDWTIAELVAMLCAERMVRDSRRALGILAKWRGGKEKAAP